MVKQKGLKRQRRQQGGFLASLLNRANLKDKNGKKIKFKTYRQMRGGKIKNYKKTKKGKLDQYGPSFLQD